MSDAFVVFIRFFSGYSESFPFERINHLKDEDIRSAIESLGNEWWENSDNQLRFNRAKAESEKRQKRWNAGALAMPGVNWTVPGQTAKNTRKKKRRQDSKPTLEEIIMAAGWRGPWKAFDHGVSPRFPVAFFKTKDLAEIAVNALQERVDELARSARERYDEGAIPFAKVNPRFFIVAENELSPAERVSVYEKIRRVCAPAGKNQPLEEGLLRIFLPEIQGTLEQVREMESASNDPAANQPTVENQPAAPASNPASEQEAIEQGEPDCALGKLDGAITDQSKTSPASTTEELMNDPTAYRPAREFLEIEGRFPTYKTINKALEENPWIRRKRPIGKNGKPILNRLEIHAGDWHQFRQQGQTADPLDMPAEMVDAALETTRRQEEIRRSKDGPKK